MCAIIKRVVLGSEEASVAMKLRRIIPLIVAGILATQNGCALLPFVSLIGTPSPVPTATPLPILTPTPVPDRITISYLDVGQGDSELIQTPHGQTILIDAGTSAACSGIVQPYLASMGIATIDLYVISHPHADHYGASTLFTAFPVKQIWEPGVTSPPSGFLSLLDTLNPGSFEKLNPRAGYSASLDGTQLEVVAPENPLIGDHNNDSLVFRLTYKNNRFLFPGDAELESWSRMIASQGEKLRSDVLKVSHHGSRNGTSQNVLNAVSPKYAVISCGKDNNYGHPHAETMTLLQGAGIPVYRTDEQGTIKCYSDGSHIQFSTANHPSTETAQTPVPVQPSFTPSPTPTPMPVASYVVGNKNTKAYHIPTCYSAGLISETNRITFSSWSQAEASGYHACGVCGGR